MFVSIHEGLNTHVELSILLRQSDSIESLTFKTTHFPSKFRWISWQSKICYYLSVPRVVIL